MIDRAHHGDPDVSFAVAAVVEQENEAVKRFNQVVRGMNGVIKGLNALLKRGF